MSELEEFLNAVVPRQVEADNALVNGDPEPRIELWSHHDPVTLLGAHRSANGWDQVSQTFRWLAARFSEGELHLQVIAAGVSGDLAAPSATSRRGPPLTAVSYVPSACA